MIKTKKSIMLSKIKHDTTQYKSVQADQIVGMHRIFTI